MNKDMLRHSFEKNYVTLNTVLIHEKALRYNLNLYSRLLPGQSICPVLKANAYGHGLVAAAQIMEKEKPAFLIVDSLYEGYELREAKIKTPILVIGYTDPKNLAYPHRGFEFATFNEPHARTLAQRKTPVHLKIDTGMSRMGFSIQALKKALPAFKKSNLTITGIFTHLADADNPLSKTYTEEQVRVFSEALALVRRAGFSPRWIHIAASGGALKIKFPEANMVRLGLALYGINPYNKADPYFPFLKGLKPALELRSTLTGIQDLRKGQKVGYGITYTASRKIRVGVIPAGYYEAVPRALSNKGWVEIHGKLCPIVGRVCMNYLMADISHVKAKLLDPVVIYSKENAQPNSVRNASELAGTIPYEVLVRICESLLRKVI